MSICINTQRKSVKSIVISLKGAYYVMTRVFVRLFVC